MQTAVATINLGGDARNTAERRISPAEFKVLTRLHGIGSVHSLTNVQDEERSFNDDVTRVKATYAGARNSETGQPLYEEALAPYYGSQPETFQAIGLTEMDFADGQMPAKASKASKAKPDADDMLK